MKLNNYINSKVTYLSLTGLILLGLTSCGSYQSATYEDDGIYGSGQCFIGDNSIFGPVFRDAEFRIAGGLNELVGVCLHLCGGLS